jgi:hypothetical protein
VLQAAKVSQSGEDSFTVKIKFKYLLVNLITTSSVKMLPRTNTIAVGKSRFPAIVSSGWKKVIFQSSALVWEVCRPL